MRDSSAYYLLGYNSSGAPGRQVPRHSRPDQRPGVQVRARKGYWALSPEEAARATAAPKEGPPPAVSRAIAAIAPTAGSRRFVRTWFGTAQGADGQPRVTFVWEPIPPAPGVRREEPRQVTLVAQSPSGEEYFNGAVGDEAALARGATVSFDVKPGKVRLRLAVEGEGTVALDNEDRELLVPDLTAPDLQLATPRVVVARNGFEFQQLRKDPAPTPTALREFRRTDRLVVRFNAFGAPSGQLALSARLLNKQGQKMTDLPVATPQVQPEGRQVDLPLSSLAVGEYLLEVSAAAEGQDAATELVAFRVVG